MLVIDLCTYNSTMLVYYLGSWKTLVMSRALSICVFYLYVFCVSCDLDLPEGSKCRANGKEGRCLIYKRCLSIIIDRKEGTRPEICSYVNRVPVICCTDCDLVEDVDKIVVDPKVGYRYKDGSKSWDYCLTSFQTLPYSCKEHFIATLAREWNETRQCHNIHYSSVGAAGGEDAKREEFPHMALLGYGEDESSTQWLCGGALISDRYILTAAHCISSNTLGPVTYAALGILKRSDPAELWQKYRIEAIIAHPQYKSPKKYHDIALLKTSQPVKFSSAVLPACVNSRDTIESKFTWAHAMGWGGLGHNRPLADTLQKVVVHQFTEQECSNLYKPHRHLLDGYDHATQMCYGDRNDIKDTCQGDSGGPLITGSGCMMDVTGVTSYGRACGFPGQAGMYTRVRPYVPWIESIVWPDL